ncbi:hypothetical protein ABE67_14100 [Cytobacillus firmus]|uniref:hypothetical protein n=1 Tax=Cytobacillus firmus TaxID=1399 RepID=UPI0018CEF39B|nr:hypothetical protein [Cytobacillus firmus]MBG9450425.1 hypothetical protein [Cytobacillus firmus]
MNNFRCGNCGNINTEQDLYRLTNTHLACMKCRKIIINKSNEVNYYNYLLEDTGVVNFLNSFVYDYFIYEKLTDKQIVELLGYPALFIPKKSSKNEFCQKNKFASLKIIEFFELDEKKIGQFFQEYLGKRIAVKTSNIKYFESQKHVEPDQSTEGKILEMIFNYLVGKFIMPGFGLMVKLDQLYVNHKIKKEYKNNLKEMKEKEKSNAAPQSYLRSSKRKFNKINSFYIYIKKEQSNFKLRDH